MIPLYIKLNDIKEAIKEIDIDGVPHNRQSVHYDLLFNGNAYPPKYIISIACKYAFGEELISTFFHAMEAKLYLENLGLIIVDRRGDNSKLILNEDDETEYFEGRKLFKIHQSRERDTNLSKKAKSNRLAETGCLECEVCEFDFYKTFGEVGHGFIEAHHKIPVHLLDGNTKTKISDLIF